MDAKKQELQLMKEFFRRGHVIDPPSVEAQKRKDVRTSWREPNDRVEELSNGFRDLIGDGEVPHIFENKGYKLSGILCTRASDSGRALHGPKRKRAVILCHGFQGHKNYLFLPMLARRLPFDTFRFDFRGNGGSEGEFLMEGALEEVSDLEAAVDYVEYTLGYEVYAIIGHSRGAVAALMYASHHGDRVRHIVNVSGRFDFVDAGPTEEQMKILREKGEVKLSFTAGGRHVTYTVTEENAAAVPLVDLSCVMQMDPRVGILTIHGTEDTTASVRQAALFANLAPNHTLHIVPGADHNWKGFFDDVCQMIERYLTLHASVDANVKQDALPSDQTTPDVQQLYKELQLEDGEDIALNHYRLIPVLATTPKYGSLGHTGALLTNRPDTGDNVYYTQLVHGPPAIPLTKTAVPGAYIHPRWRQIWTNRVVPVEGVRNFRDAGGYPVHHGGRMRSRYAFRASEFSRITPKGRIALQQLGIVRIFDLRSELEVKRKRIGDVGTVVVEHCPVLRLEDYSPAALAERWLLYTQGREGFVKAYANILENIQDTMYKICQHILNGGGPFVFNCSAGKDRTGIVAMLLQLIAGVDEAFICWDYGLTETLAPPEKEMIDKIVQLTNGSINEAQAHEMLGAKYEYMSSTLAMFYEKYHSIQEFMRGCGINDEQFAILRERLCDPPTAML